MRFRTLLPVIPTRPSDTAPSLGLAPSRLSELPPPNNDVTSTSLVPPIGPKAQKPKALAAADPLLVNLYPRLAFAPLGRRTRHKNGPILPHWHRPHVEAGDRLFFWVSSAAISNRAALWEKLSPREVVYWDYNIPSILAVSTRATYGAGLMDWIVHCDTKNVPEHMRFPADKHILQSFIMLSSGEIGESKVNNVMAALAMWHHIHDLPWVGREDPLVNKLKKLAIAQAPADTVRPPRPPVTLDHLLALRKLLDIVTSPFDAAVWALATSAFWGTCRLGELTSPSLNDKEPSHRATRGSSRLKWTTKTQGGKPVTVGAQWFIPWTKTTKHVGATISISHWPHDSSPLPALANHLLRNKLPPEATLFAYTNPADPRGWSPMVKSVFMKRCTDIWKESKLGPCSGHSFRIGGATELIRQGLTFEWVCLQGRWSSEAWRRYIRNTPELLQMEVDRVQAASLGFRNEV